MGEKNYSASIDLENLTHKVIYLRLPVDSTMYSFPVADSARFENTAKILK